LVVRYPLGRALAAWTKLLMASKMPLLLLDLSHLRIPVQCCFMVWTASLIGSRRL
jgi:hypothetical protein